MTAEIIVKRISAPTGPAGSQEIRLDRRLREIDTGLWEGLTLEEAQRLYPREHAERERDLVGYPFPGGESFRLLQRRVVTAFLDILDEDGGNVLVVGHRGANRVLLCHLLGLPLERLFSIEQDYCCVNLIEASPLPDGSRKIDVVTPWPTADSPPKDATSST
jgi:broad specificity phosphatase PhoE